MKFNVPLALITILLSVLISVMVFYLASGKENDILCGFVTMVTTLSTLGPIVCFSYEPGRLEVNLKVLSTVSFIILLLINLGFAIFGVVMPYYIVITGIILLAFLAAFYKLSQIKDI